MAATTKVNDAQVSQEISNIKQSIVALDSKISSILSNLGTISCNTVSPITNGIESLATSTTVGNKKKSDLVKSYVAAVGCDLPSIVRSVVNESVKAQRNNEKDNSSVVIYGLKEANNDLAKVRNLLKVCDCEDTVVHVIRLGKFSARPNEVNFKRTCHPLKVE